MRSRLYIFGEIYFCKGRQFEVVSGAAVWRIRIYVLPSLTLKLSTGGRRCEAESLYRCSYRRLPLPSSLTLDRARLKQSHIPRAGDARMYTLWAD